MLRERKIILYIWPAGITAAIPRHIFGWDGYERASENWRRLCSVKGLMIFWNFQYVYFRCSSYVSSRYLSLFYAQKNMESISDVSAHRVSEIHTKKQKRKPFRVKWQPVRWCESIVERRTKWNKKKFETWNNTVSIHGSHRTTHFSFLFFIFVLILIYFYVQKTSHHNFGHLTK